MLEPQTRTVRFSRLNLINKIQSPHLHTTWLNWLQGGAQGICAKLNLLKGLPNLHLECVGYSDQLSPSALRTTSQHASTRVLSSICGKIIYRVGHLRTADDSVAKGLLQSGGAKHYRAVRIRPLAAANCCGATGNAAAAPLQGRSRFMAPVAARQCGRPEMATQHATVIPRLTYPAPSEPGSQAPVGIVSSEMGDLSRIRCAVVFCPVH